MGGGQQLRQGGFDPVAQINVHTRPGISLLFHVRGIKSVKQRAGEKISRGESDHPTKLPRRLELDTNRAMKAFVAYALVVMGFPIIGGFLLAAILYVPAYLLLSRCPIKFAAKALPYLEVFTGVGVAIAALVLFRWFKMTPNFAVPIILAAWTFVYFVQYKHTLSAWISWLAGFFISWFALAQMLIPQG